jgi:hypothetical protein
MWVAVADCCLLLKLKLSPTPGLSIDCCCFIKLERCLSTAGGYRTVLPLPCCCLSSNSSVASPLRAATKRFFHFLVVVHCLGSRVRHVVSTALRGPFSIVGMLPALRGLFFLVDMLQTLSGLFFVVDMLPGSPLSGHLPFVAFLLVGSIVLIFL